MSRRCAVVCHLACALGPLVATLLIAPAVIAQEARPSLPEILAMPLDTRDFIDPIPFNGFAQMLYEKFATKGLELPVVINYESFLAPDLDQHNGLESDEVRLPPVPKQMSVATALRLAVGQLKTPAAFVLRNGMVEIVAKKAATPEALLRYKIVARFDSVPVHDALRRISDMTGVSVVVDARVEEKAKPRVSATFRGDVPAETAVRMIADMADLRCVVMDGGVYVTTPANADALEKRQRERK